MLHEARDDRRLLIEQSLESLATDFVEHARRFDHGAGRTLVLADEYGQLAEVLSGPEQFVGQPIVEAESHLAGIDQVHAAGGIAAQEQFLARQDSATDRHAGERALFFRRQYRRQPGVAGAQGLALRKQVGGGHAALTGWERVSVTKLGPPTSHRSANSHTGRLALAAQAALTSASPWNCSSSVEPFRAVVELCPPWMAWVTESK